MTKEPDSKKTFYKLSNIAQFHIAPKLFGDDAEYPFYDAEIKDIRSSIIEGALSATEKEGELSTPEGRHLKKIIQDVFNVKLNNDGKNNPEEKKKLELCRKKIIEYLNNVLNSVKSYIGTILFLSEAAKGNDKSEIARADDKRKLSHNRLIEDINILNRSLVWWFGKFDPDNLSDFQIKMYEKQKNTYISFGIGRIDISSNGICPPNINVADRTEITKWAKAIYKDLISIQKLSGTIDLSGD